MGNRLRTALRRQVKAGPQFWHFCPRCGGGYRIQPGNKCFCIYDAENGSWLGVPLVLAEDQEAAEAAYRLGGSQAVGQLFGAQELKRG